MVKLLLYQQLTQEKHKHGYKMCKIGNLQQFMYARSQDTNLKVMFV